MSSTRTITARGAARFIVGIRTSCVNVTAICPSELPVATVRKTYRLCAVIGSATAPVSQYTVFSCSARADAAAESVLPYVPRMAGT